MSRSCPSRRPRTGGWLEGAVATVVSHRPQSGTIFRIELKPLANGLSLLRADGVEAGNLGPKIVDSDKIAQERQTVTELNQQLHVLEQTLKG